MSLRSRSPAMPASALPTAGAGPVGRARLFVVLAGLYLAQGIPGYLIVAALPPILREQGVSRTTLGFMALLMLPLVIKFLWAPLVDRVTPLAIGHRRGWIVITQSLTALVILSLAFVAPTDVVAIFVIGLLISILTSTQDIATDGYATIMLAAEDRATGNAIQGGAVALSVIVGGTLALLLYGWIGWPATMVVMAVISTLPLAAALLMHEDARPAAARERPSLKAFLARPETHDILIVALVYRASEGLMKAMEGPYLVDAGLPLSWIGYLSGASAATAGIGGSVVAALCLRRIGEGATLGLLGGLRTLCFFLFFLHAAGVLTGTIPLLGAAGFQTMIRYMEIVALYSLFMGAASSRQPGTDFTILACAQLLVYLVGSMLAGVLADALGYPALFAISTAISAVAVVYTTRRLSRRHCPRRPEGRGEARSAPLPLLRHRHRQRHGEGHAGRERAEAGVIGLRQLEPDGGGFGKRREGRIGQRHHGHAARRETAGLRHAFRGIGRERHGKARIAGAGHGDHVVIDAGGAADQAIGHFQLAEGIGHVAGQRIGAALGDQQDRVGRAEDFHRLLEGDGIDGAGGIVERAMRGGDEAVEDRAAFARIMAIFAKRLQPVLIAGCPLLQPRLEHLLQGRKAVIAEMLAQTAPAWRAAHGPRPQCSLPCRRPPLRDGRA